MQMPPSANESGPPQVKNLSSGAHAAVNDRPLTAPAVYAAARKTKGPPTSTNGAITAPTTALCPFKINTCLLFNTTYNILAHQIGKSKIINPWINYENFWFNAMKI